MQGLLDEQIAARIKAECRDASELHRFQRGVFILAQLLDSMGLPKTAKAFHLLRAGAGEIPDTPPATPAEPLVHPPFVLPESVPARPEPEADVLTGRKRRRKESA